MTQSPSIPLLPPAASSKAKSRKFGLLGNIALWSLVMVLLRLYAPDWYRDVVRGNMLVFMALLLVCAWVHVIIHELGHALVGKLVGMEVFSIGVFRWRWDHDGETWRRRYGEAVAGISGYVLLAPRPGTPLSRSRIALYALGGPAANLLLAVPVLAIWLVGDVTGVAKLALGAWVFVGLAFGLVNLLPFRSGGFRTDGGKLLDLLRDPQGVFIGFMALQVIRASRSGTRARDWDEGLLAPWADYRELQTDDRVAAAGNCLLRALDQNDPAVADDCARCLLEHFSTASGATRSGIALLMAMHAVPRGHPLEAIRAWRAEIGPHLIDLGAYRAWLDAEIALREGRSDEARSQLEIGRAHV